jgi:hypothetical protein
MLALVGTNTAVGKHHLGRRGAARVAAVAIMAGLALGLAACGSSSPKAATSTTVAINPATAQTDISTAYDTLFNLSNPSLAGKLVVIQDGQQVKPALQQALSSSEASAAQGAKIDSIKILTSAQCAKESLPAQCAHVLYDILGSGGTAILANNTGYAVYSGGHWLVAKATICTLLGLFYSAEGKTGSPPGC